MNHEELERDQAWVAEVERGEADARREFYRRFERDLFAAALRWCQRSCGQRPAPPTPLCWRAYRRQRWFGLLPAGPECDELAAMLAFLLEKLPRRLAAHLRYVAADPRRRGLYGGLQEAVAVVLMNRQFFDEYVRHVRGREDLPVALRVRCEVEKQRAEVVARIRRGETVEDVAAARSLTVDDVKQLLAGEAFRLLRRRRGEEAIAEHLGWPLPQVRDLVETLMETLKKAGTFWEHLGPLLFPEGPWNVAGEGEETQEPEVPTGADGPAGSYQARVVRETVREGLAQLPPVKREALRQMACGQTAKETAAILNRLELDPEEPEITTRRVYTLVSQALGYLQEHLEKNLDTRVGEELLRNYVDDFGKQLFDV